MAARLAEQSGAELTVVEVAAIHGLPQVEIGRLAEDRKADLIVLGRKPRSRTTRMFLGDTADAVVRRSRIPCLLVPPGLGGLSRMLVALDGTDRGFIVYALAMDLAHAGSMQLSAVTVEPAWPGEPAALAGTLPSARSERLAAMIAGQSRRASQTTETLKPRALQVRHGDIVDEVVAAVTDTAADVLVLGFHRGGPALVVEGGSVSRRLLHVAPCAVLTLPF